MSLPILAPLLQLITGLVYISESEHPFEVQVWKDVHSPQQVQAKIKGEGDVQTIDPEKFFHKLIYEQDMEDAFVKEQAGRFGKLHDFLKSNLKELAVYKTEGVQKHLYISGFLTSGECIALHTVSIET